MKIKLKAKLLTVLAILTLGIGWVTFNTNSTYAEGGETELTVTPMAQKIVLVPGETYSGSISVANSAKATADLKYIVEIGSYNPTRDESSKDDYDTSDVTKVTEYNIIKDWMTIDKTGGILAPNNSEVINFTIKVPKNAPAGAQYASLLVYRNDKTQPTNDSNIVSKFQMASVIFANVAGETIEKASIKENSMPSMLTTNNLEATSMVRNDGNIYTDATYILQVWPMGSDEEICTNEEKPETALVLPGTERYHTQTCNLPAVGIFKAKQVVKIFDEVSVLEKTIFVCPIWLMVVVLLVVIGIIVAITVYIKKRHSAKEVDD